MTVWFDVEDMVHYFRSGNRRISGIQRLSFEIFRAAKALGTHEIGFVRHGAKMPALLPVAWADLLAEFGAEEPVTPYRPPMIADEGTEDAVPVPEAAPRSLPRRLAKRAADRLPPEIRKPLVLASVMQLQAGASLARFGVNLAALPVRRGYGGARKAAAALAPRKALPRPAGATFDSLAQPGDTLLVLGAPWNRERYSDIARHVRDERRMRFGVLVHDLVPIRHPEWCPRGVPRQFRAWYADVLPFCDVVFANSRHTADDVEAYARESAMVLNRPVQPLPIGTGFGTEAAPVVTERLPPPGSYVLFVSTMEARKNHALVVRLWSLLLDEVAAGRRSPECVPELVFTGRVGWLVSDLLAQLEATQWLGGRIRMVPDPSDGELRALYAGCLFTIFPSLHEGWGLPVTESLSLGKPCLSSNAASLPEAGGPLCRYFDPESLPDARRALTAVLDEAGAIAAWERTVREGFAPVPWTRTAGALLEALDSL